MLTYLQEMLLIHGAVGNNPAGKKRQDQGRNESDRRPIGPSGVRKPDPRPGQNKSDHLQVRILDPFLGGLGTRSPRINRGFRGWQPPNGESGGRKHPKMKRHSGPYLARVLGLFPQLASRMHSWHVPALFGVCPQPVSSACVLRAFLGRSAPYLGCVLSLCPECLSGSLWPSLWLCPRPLSSVCVLSAFILPLFCCQPLFLMQCPGAHQPYTCKAECSSW